MNKITISQKLLEAYQEKDRALANLEQIHVEIEHQQAKLLEMNLCFSRIIND